MEFALRRTTHDYPNGQFTIPVRPKSPRSHELDLPGGWVVQKFGGTSVGKLAGGIARDVVATALQTNRIAVVCSARSALSKNEGTTTRLLRAAKEAEKPDSKKYYSVVDAIKEDHITAAKKEVKTQSLLDQLVADIEKECDELTKILESAQHLEEVSPRAEDRIVSKGEKLSCLFMVAVLKENGVDATYVDLADFIKAGSTSASQGQRLDQSFYKSIAKKLGEYVLNKCGETVPVITGFFGNIAGGLMSTVGRGYTDLCAALIAVGIKAKELQIWKEVDGIFTADPRKVPTARLLSTVSPSEAAELTFYGSEVVHPFTMEQAIRAQIPIRIKNVMNPRNKGTVIFPDPGEDREPMNGNELFRARSPRSETPPTTKPKRPTAVTIKKHIFILNVHSNKRTRSHGFMRNIFAILDKWHLTVDLISSSEVHVSMALHSETGLLTGGGSVADFTPINIQNEDLLNAVSELKEFGTIDLLNDMAIVSLVGKQLKNMIGISGKFFSTLGDNNINIEMISQGASEVNISCVIAERQADRALNILHTNLFTFLD